MWGEMQRGNLTGEYTSLMFLYEFGFVYYVGVMQRDNLRGGGKNKTLQKCGLPSSSHGFLSALSFPSLLHPFRIFTRLLWAVCSVSFGEFRLTSFASGLLFCTFQDYFVARYRNLHAVALWEIVSLSASLSLTAVAQR